MRILSHHCLYSKHHICGASQMNSYATSVMCILNSQSNATYRNRGQVKWLEKYDVLNSHILPCSSVMDYAVKIIQSLVESDAWSNGLGAMFFIYSFFIHIGIGAVLHGAALQQVVSFIIMIMWKAQPELDMDTLYTVY